MEPWKRGSLACRLIGNHGRFNGATAMEPWKSGLSPVVASRGFKLQWGHGDGAVEETGFALFCRRMKFASMGPRRWSRGRAVKIAAIMPITPR